MITVINVEIRSLKDQVTATAANRLDDDGGGWAVFHRLLPSQRPNPTQPVVSLRKFPGPKRDWETPT